MTKRDLTLRNDVGSVSESIASNIRARLSGVSCDYFISLYPGNVVVESLDIAVYATICHLHGIDKETA